MQNLYHVYHTHHTTNNIPHLSRLPAPPYTLLYTTPPPASDQDHSAPRSTFRRARSESRHVHDPRPSRDTVLYSRTPKGSLSPRRTPKGSLSPRRTPKGSLSPRRTPKGSLSPRRTPKGSLSPRKTPKGSLSPRRNPKGSLSLRQTHRTLNSFKTPKVQEFNTHTCPVEPPSKTQVLSTHSKPPRTFNPSFLGGDSTIPDTHTISHPVTPSHPYFPPTHLPFLATSSHLLVISPFQHPNHPLPPTILLSSLPATIPTHPPTRTCSRECLDDPKRRSVSVPRVPDCTREYYRVPKCAKGVPSVLEGNRSARECQPRYRKALVVSAIDSPIGASAATFPPFYAAGGRGGRRALEEEQGSEEGAGRSK
ncbi:hypothetical protein O3P69_008925 [Scylla paramamosain]|uniref:Uncharacterized protein n=1 Tax=Scylla paramamosain TaxID=85552 RepID=A0AAW0TPF4_SCYPA